MVAKTTLTIYTYEDFAADQKVTATLFTHAVSVPVLHKARTIRNAIYTSDFASYKCSGLYNTSSKPSAATGHGKCAIFTRSSRLTQSVVYVRSE